MTGDFISFSRSSPIRNQIAARFDATGFTKLTVEFGQSVGETTFSGVFLRLLSLKPRASRAEIDERQPYCRDFHQMRDWFCSTSHPLCALRPHGGNRETKSALLQDDGIVHPGQNTVC